MDVLEERRIRFEKVIELKNGLFDVGLALTDEEIKQIEKVILECKRRIVLKNLEEITKITKGLNDIERNAIFNDIDRIKNDMKVADKEEEEVEEDEEDWEDWDYSDYNDVDWLGGTESEAQFWEH